MIIANNNMRGLLLALGSLILMCSTAHVAASDDIVVRQAWMRATPKGAQVAGGYLTIENHGTVADKLISAATPAASKVEIHEMKTLDDIMMMRPVDGGLVIPPGASVTFAPGGNHLMFIGLGAPYSEGEHVAAALMFEKAGKIDLTFHVGSIGARGPQLIVASTEAAVPATSALQPPPGDFLTHICGTRVMANVTVSPGREGPIDIFVELEDANEQPLAVQGLSVALSDSERGIALIGAKAVRVSDEKWRVRLPGASAGKWSLALGINVTSTDRIDIAAPVLIEK
jgi:copper(I)-binding protein